MKLALFFFLICVAFSTENKKTDGSLPHRSSDLQHQKVSLQQREKRVEIAEEKLKAREEKLQEQEKQFKRTKRRAQYLQKMEDALHYREQMIKVAEKKFQKEQEIIQLQKQIQKYKQFAHEQISYSNSSNQHERLRNIKWSELSEKEKSNKKMQMTANQLSNIRISGLLEIYPNESSIKVFRDMETNAISWEDPYDLVRDEIKKWIEFSLQKKPKEMSNGLFDCIFEWYTYHIPNEANPFVRELLFPMSNFVDIDKRDKSFRTPLMLTSGFDAEKAIVKLIERDAETEAVDQDNRTALHYAARNGNALACKVLLQKNANVNAQNKNSQTPLMWAALYGHVEVVKLLLKSGANTEIKNACGETAFQLASPNCANAITAHKACLKINKAKLKN